MGFALDLGLESAELDLVEGILTKLWVSLRRTMPECITIVTVLFRHPDFTVSTTQSSNRGALHFPGAFSEGDRLEAASLARNYLSLSDKGTCCEISTLSDSCMLLESGKHTIR